MKKLLSLLLTLTMVLCVFVPSVADETPLAGQLVILHTNDVHGRAVTTDSSFGYAGIAALKDSLEAQGCTVMLLDAGDFSQGMPITNINYGRNGIEFLNAVGYTAAVPGNHEFDWGYDNLQQNAAAAAFPILAANILDVVSKECVFAPNSVYEYNGFKVGVFGLATPETMTKAHPDKVRGITFLQGEELYACAQAQVDALRAEGCQLVICLGHLGDDSESAPNRSTDVLENTTGIDLFIDGHSHSTIDGGVKENGTLRVSTGDYSANIGYVIVNYKTKDDALVLSYDCGLYTHKSDAQAKMATGIGLGINEFVADTVNTINNAVNEELGTPFARTEVRLNGERNPGNRTEETNLGDFATDAILWAARQSFSSDVDAALTNGGGIRTSIEIGDISMLDMKSVFPFGNAVSVLSVTGAELLEALEAATHCTPTAIGAFPQVSGIEYTINTTVEYQKGEQYPSSTYFAPAVPGSRVTITTVNGKPFDPEAIYQIATNDFTAAGGDTYYAFKYANSTTGVNTGLSLEDALVQYTQQVLGGVVGQQYAEPQGRITVIR